jgi:hypothetical protein
MQEVCLFAKASEENVPCPVECGFIAAANQQTRRRVAISSCITLLWA